MDYALGRARRSFDRPFSSQLEFGRWLAGNIDVLGDAVGLDLTGSLGLQIGSDIQLLEDSLARTVFLTADLGATTDFELGRVVGELANAGGGPAIWVAEDPLPRHVAACLRLNRSQLFEIYLAKVQFMVTGTGITFPILSGIIRPGGPEPSDEVRPSLCDRMSRRARWWRMLGETPGAKIDFGQFRPETATGIFKRIHTSSIGYVVGESSCFVQVRVGTWSREDRGLESKVEAARLMIEEAVSPEVVIVHTNLQGQLRIEVSIPIGFNSDPDLWPEGLARLVGAHRRLGRVMKRVLQN